MTYIAYINRVLPNNLAHGFLGVLLFPFLVGIILDSGLESCSLGMISWYQMAQQQA